MSLAPQHQYLSVFLLYLQNSPACYPMAYQFDQHYVIINRFPLKNNIILTSPNGPEDSRETHQDQLLVIFRETF